MGQIEEDIAGIRKSSRTVIAAKLIKPKVCRIDTKKLIAPEETVRVHVLDIKIEGNSKFAALQKEK